MAPSFGLSGFASIITAASLVLATGCNGPTTDEGSTSAQVAQSPNGMVVSGSPLATDAGRRILEQGGNAVDAAAATAFVLSVVEPTMSGLGGRTQMLIRLTDGSFVGLNGGTQVPLSYTSVTEETSDTAYGIGTIGTPGTVAALVKMVEDHGSMSLAEVMAPAIELAENGFPLPTGEALRLATIRAKLSEFEGSRRYFLKQGVPYSPGEIFVQTDLARTLRAVAEGGAEVFYTGWIADSIAEYMRRVGGYVTREDLRSFRANESLVVRGNYRGYDLVGTYLPASGATTIEILHLLEQFDLQGLKPAEWAALVTQSLLIGFEDRAANLGDEETKPALLVSKEWARERAATIRVPFDASPTPATTTESPNTTHLSVVDNNGMVVALTQSVGPNSGSKVAAPGLGFFFAATMEYLDVREPGQQPWSSQSPLIVMSQDQPILVVGAAGARRIISAIVETLSYAIDYGLPLDEAMGRPRFHPTGQMLYMEDLTDLAWPDSTILNLGRLGFNAVPKGDQTTYFARIHGIAFDSVRGTWIGVADKRWVGSAAGAN